MPQIVYTPQARQDLVRCYHFLLEKDADAARAAVRAIRQSLHLLQTHPDLGRPAKGRPSGFREWNIPFGKSGYIALYFHDNREIVVLAVKHQRELAFQV